MTYRNYECELRVQEKVGFTFHHITLDVSLLNKTCIDHVKILTKELCCEEKIMGCLTKEVRQPIIFC